MKKQNAFLTWILVMVLGAACALASTPAHAQSRFCASAWIQEPFILPDGSAHAPGTLKVCTDTAISPVAQLQRTYVDGMPIGAFLSRRQTGELPVSDKAPALFVFQRDLEGRLCLERYAVWDGRKARSFDMTTAKSNEMVARGRKPAPLQPLPEKETIVVAATRN